MAITKKQEEEFYNQAMEGMAKNPQAIPVVQKAYTAYLQLENMRAQQKPVENTTQLAEYKTALLDMKKFTIDAGDHPGWLVNRRLESEAKKNGFKSGDEFMSEMAERFFQKVTENAALRKKQEQAALTASGKETPQQMLLRIIKEEEAIGPFPKPAVAPAETADQLKLVDIPKPDPEWLTSMQRATKEKQVRDAARIPSLTTQLMPPEPEWLPIVKQFQQNGGVSRVFAEPVETAPTKPSPTPIIVETEKKTPGVPR